MAIEHNEPNAIVDVGFPLLVAVVLGGLVALISIAGGLVVAGLTFMLIKSLDPVDGTRLPRVSEEEAERIEAIASDNWDGVER
jgi:hypothetical protein